MEYPKKVDVLGTEYTIEKHTYQEDAELDGLGGYCRTLVPIIVVADLTTNESLKDAYPDTLEQIERNTLRHELIHAFLNESGLGDSAFASDTIPWSKNEEMIDWFAIQSPKIMKAFSELGIV